MKRRNFLSLLATSSVIYSFGSSSMELLSNDGFDNTAQSIVEKVLAIGQKKRWQHIPIGERMGLIGQAMLGTEYKAGPLESATYPFEEQCIVNLAGVDCFTFMEAVLCLARVMNASSHLPSFTDFMEQVLLTRYRKGQLSDYTSRLHYTSEWIYDNQQKGIVEDITQRLGGVPMQNEIFFMSKNPQYYDALKENPEFVSKIASTESFLNKQTRYFIPQKHIQNIEHELQTGDIIAITTNITGLDYGHVGLVFREKDSKTPRLLHASTNHKKVHLDHSVSRYVQSIKKHIGITVVRAKEV